MESNPDNDSSSFVYLARAMITLHRYPEALDAAQTAHQLDPNNRDAIAAYHIADAEQKLEAKRLAQQKTAPAPDNTPTFANLLKKICRNPALLAVIVLYALAFWGLNTTPTNLIRYEWGRASMAVGHWIALVRVDYEMRCKNERRGRYQYLEKRPQDGPYSIYRCVALSCLFTALFGLKIVLPLLEWLGWP